MTTRVFSERLMDIMMISVCACVLCVCVCAGQVIPLCVCVYYCKCDQVEKNKTQTVLFLNKFGAILQFRADVSRWDEQSLLDAHLELFNNVFPAIVLTSIGVLESKST